MLRAFSSFFRVSCTFCVIYHVSRTSLGVPLSDDAHRENMNAILTQRMPVGADLFVTLRFFSFA